MTPDAKSKRLPEIALVTPSLNGAEWLESSMQSVLNQNYSQLQYVVIDGGSDDGSVEIIRRYEDSLHAWASEPDQGPYSALNKGFAMTSGEIMGWLNSDDEHTPWCLDIVSEIFESLPQVDWITSQYPLSWGTSGKVIGCSFRRGFTRRGFYRGEHLGDGRSYMTGWIQQESTFWRRSLWNNAGGYLDEEFSLAADFELWARFFKHADLYAVAVPLAGFRQHSEQRTTLLGKSYVVEAVRALRMHGGRPYGILESKGQALIDRLPSVLKPMLRSRRPFNICAYDVLENSWRTELAY